MSDSTHRKYEHEMRVWEANLRVWEANLAHTAAVFSAHVAAVGEFSSLLLKSIILANGAVAGGILAFLGTMWGNEKITPVLQPALDSIEVFALGTFAALLSASFRYLCQLSYVITDLHELGPRSGKVVKGAGMILQVLAILAAAAGLFTFAYGTLEGVQALRMAKGELPS